MMMVLGTVLPRSKLTSEGAALDSSLLIQSQKKDQHKEPELSHPRRAPRKCDVGSLVRSQVRPEIANFLLQEYSKHKPWSIGDSRYPQNQKL
jgi:hypothetical protein